MLSDLTDDMDEVLNDDLLDDSLDGVTPVECTDDGDDVEDALRSLKLDDDGLVGDEGVDELTSLAD